MNLFKTLRGSALVSIGYMLSPLSWWNDLFFNLPIALVFGYGVSWINSHWFMPGTVIGYWLSNVLGMVMIQFGAIEMLLAGRSTEHDPRYISWLWGRNALYRCGFSFNLFPPARHP